MIERLVDCRGKPQAEAIAAIVARYNAAAPGERFEALLSELGAGLRIALLEAGARHQAARGDDASWRLSFQRGAAAAQGSMPGLHHVLSGRGGWLWTCERGSRVARIDAQNGRVAAVRAAARKASHLALAENAGRLFVADAEGSEMIALRADDLGEIARWPAPGMPQLPLVSAEGIVCITGGATGTVTLAWPRGEGYRSASFTVGAAPHDACLDRDGAHLFVPCAGDGTVVKLRLSDGAVLGTARVGDGPSHLAPHPDGTRLYCANSWEGGVTCMSVEGVLIARAASGGWAHAIELSPDGRSLHVANFLDDSVSVFDADTLEHVASLATESYPHGLDVSPDGRYLVATGFASDCVRIFDARSRRQLARVEVGWGSSHTAFGPGERAWIGCSIADHLACIDLGSMRCIARVAL